MKKYIKDTNLVPIDNKIKIFSQISNIPTNLNNEIVIVSGIGIYKCNGDSIIQIYNDCRNMSVGGIVGEIRMFYGNTIPTNWLECNGGTFSSSSYPKLYTFLGTNKVPDYREMALRGGTPVGTFSNDAMGSHSHTFSGGTHTHTRCGSLSHSHYLQIGVYNPKYYNNSVSSSSVMCACCPTYNACGVCVTSSATNCQSMVVCANTSGITVGASPWASTVTRAREIGVRYIMYTGA